MADKRKKGDQPKAKAKHPKHGATADASKKGKGKKAPSKKKGGKKAAKGPAKRDVGQAVKKKAKGSATAVAEPQRCPCCKKHCPLAKPKCGKGHTPR